MKTKAVYTVGQRIEVELIKPNVGFFPIGITKTGMMCFMPKGTKGFWDYGTLQECEVLQVGEKHLQIRIIKELMSAAEYAKQKAGNAEPETEEDVDGNTVKVESREEMLKQKK